jgi:hypothetical protein
LARSEPSLQSVTPTFAGAFLDDYGRGVASIQVSGHTGWRLGDGWEENFRRLRDTVWTQWHVLRAAAANKGKNPDGVQLVFTDTLDNICCVVAPGSFGLKRSKSNPLLMMYDLPMVVLSDGLAPQLKDPINFAAGPSAVKTGVASLTASLSKLQAQVTGAVHFVSSSVLVPVQAFMTTTNGILGSVLSTVNTVEGVASSTAQQFIGIASDLTQVGRNAFYTFSAVAGLPDAVKYDLAVTAGAYENAYCVLRNALRPTATYIDYSDVYGASNCSSTIGGSPLSPYLGVNTFQAITPVNSVNVGVSDIARASIDALKHLDPLGTPNVANVATLMRSIASGVKVA